MPGITRTPIPMGTRTNTDLTGEMLAMRTARTARIADGEQDDLVHELLLSVGEGDVELHAPRRASQQGAEVRRWSMAVAVAHGGAHRRAEPLSLEVKNDVSRTLIQNPSFDLTPTPTPL